MGKVKKVVRIQEEVKKDLSPHSRDASEGGGSFFTSDDDTNHGAEGKSLQSIHGDMVRL